MTSKYNLISSHAFCTNNYVTIINSTECVCFYCERLFNKEKIIDWIETENEKTALCPLCGVDAVIGDASNAPIRDTVFVKAMRQHWFE